MAVVIPAKARTQFEPTRKWIPAGAGMTVAVVLCLMLAGCGLIQIGVTNSPDWCPARESKGCL